MSLFRIAEATAADVAVVEKLQKQTKFTIGTPREEENDLNEEQEGEAQSTFDFKGKSHELGDLLSGAVDQHNDDRSAHNGHAALDPGRPRERIERANHVHMPQVPSFVE